MMTQMRRYSQNCREVSVYSDLPFWRKAALMDLLYLGYGLFILVVVVASYILGSFGLLPHDHQAMDLSLLMAPPGVGGHLLGTDFMGRDILSRLIVGIQAYFLPGLLAIGIALVLGTCFGVLAGYWGGGLDTAATYLSNLLNSFPRLVLILLLVCGAPAAGSKSWVVGGETHPWATSGSLEAVDVTAEPGLIQPIRTNLSHNLALGDEGRVTRASSRARAWSGGWRLPSDRRGPEAG